jgi:hypothetical protein
MIVIGMNINKEKGPQPEAWRRLRPLVFTGCEKETIEA